MKTERTVCWGQVGQVTARILNALTFPPTIDWAIFSCTCRLPHFLQMTVEPLTVFVTVFARAAATASSGGSASATTHAAIVRAFLATTAKSSGIGRRCLAKNGLAWRHGGLRPLGGEA